MTSRGSGLARTEANTPKVQRKERPTEPNAKRPAHSWEYREP